MYQTAETFARDAQLCGSEYYEDASLEEQKIRVAYAIYQQARVGTALGITIVGRLQLKTKGKDGQFMLIPSNEWFPSIDQHMKENLRTLNEDFSNGRGSILSSDNWTLLANDAWVLGGLHSLTEFHFASPLRWSNLWDEANQRMSIMAREVIGITSSGYQLMRPNTQLETIATYYSRQEAVNASLLTYKDHVLMYQKKNAIQTQSALQEFFQRMQRMLR